MINFMDFSLKQHQAIEWDNNKELLVSAAAGSGKTTVLTARIIDRIVNRRIGIDRFFIVTYTRLAAEELKERITKALNDKLKENPDDSFLSLQIANISSATIGTMHSFCLKVLKEYHEHPSVMLPKNVKVLSESKTRELLDEATEEIFTDLYSAHDSDFELLLNTLASFKSDSEVREQVKSIYKFSLNDESPYNWLEKMRDNDGMHEFADDMYGFYEIIVKKAVDVCNYVLENYIPQAKTKTSYTEEIKYAIDLLSVYTMSIKSCNYNGAKIAADNLKSIKIKGGAVKDEAVIAQKNVLAFIKNIVYEIIKIDAEDKKSSQMYPVIRTLFDISIKVGKRFEKKKRTLKSVDYNDMEHMVLNLFDDKSISAIYSSKFEHIMFDEYQDCNRLQEKIVQKISSNAKYFMVGDIKQSIYSFRQAEPKLFLEKYKTYKYDENAPYAVIELNENYRSRENVLNAVNRVFFKVMSDEFCGMNYDSENALNAKFEYPCSMEYDTFENDPVKFTLISCAAKDSKDKHNSQILYIIDSIRSMIGKKYIFDAKEKQYRPLRYSDIAILMRSPQNNIPYIKEAFSHTEIPINIQQDTDVRFEPEINLLICLLKCIENPYNNMELMTVLHSYICNVTDSELAEFMSSDSEDVISKINFYAENGSNSELKLKLRNFLIQYAVWIENSRYMSLDDFIDYLLHDVAYYEYFTARDNGLRRRTNIDQLVSYLVQNSNSTGMSLYDCMRVIKNIDENGLNIGNNVAMSDGVSVMSIHKSKGLEFSVVFVMNINDRYSDNDLKKTLLINKDYGAVLQYIDTENRIKYRTVDYVFLHDLIKKAQQEEEQRILYVAMTRAKEHLELVGVASQEILKKQYLGENTAYIASANSYSELVLYSLCCDGGTDYSNCENASNLFGKKLKFYADNNLQYPSVWHTELMNYADGKLSAEEKTLFYNELSAITVSNNAVTENKTEYNFFAYDDLIKKLSYKYPYIEQTKINSKLSVTQIKNLLEPSQEEYIPDYRTEQNVRHITVDGSLSSTRVGSLYHFFMQHAKLVYPYTKKDFNDDIEQMLDSKLITKREAQILCADKILPFFNSEIGMRIADAEYCMREKNFSYLMDAKTVYSDILCDEKILVQGVVDCFFKDCNGKYVLIDYKTDFIVDGDEEILVLRHKKQIELYKKAIEDIESVKIDECFIFSFTLGKFIQVE